MMKNAIKNTAAMARISASADRRAEDVPVFSIVVAELEFRNIQRHVFGAHLVERAHHAALEDGPEPFDCLSVHRADDVLSFGVVDHRTDVLNNAGDYVAFALNRANDRRFAGTNATSSATFAAFVFVVVCCETSDASFVN